MQRLSIKLMLIKLWTLIQVSAAFPLKCPEPAQWAIRASGHCVDPSKYFCLQNDLIKGYSENCTRSDFQQPGRKAVLRGGIDAEICSAERYQPFPIRFYTNVSTNCIFFKSFCNEDGQVVYDHGNRNIDRTCRCDYRRGYAFLVKSKNPCLCKPLQEDCSCYLTTCLNTSHILSPDYKCIYKTEVTPVTQCRPTKEDSGNNRRRPELTVRIPDQDELSFLSPWKKRSAIVVLSIFGCTFVILLGFFSRSLRVCCYKDSDSTIQQQSDVIQTQNRQIYSRTIDVEDYEGMSAEHVFVDSTCYNHTFPPRCNNCCAAMSPCDKFCGICGQKEGTDYAKKGLAVICHHQTFDKKLKMRHRDSDIDAQLMTEAWKCYGCTILCYKDEDIKFYQTNLADKIKCELQKLGTIDYFVFVLSSHGNEILEVSTTDKQKLQFHHYFYTSDGHFRTQDVIDSIDNIQELNGKLKMFFLETCRTRLTNTEGDNQELCTESRIYKEQQQQNIRFDPSDTLGYIPVEDNTTAQSISKSKSKDVECARRYMSPPEKEKISTSEQISETLPTTIETGMDELTFTEGHEKRKDNVMEILTTVPHCDDCVVVFACMSGQSTMRTKYSGNHDGGWMVRALHSAMIRQHYPGCFVHILDICTAVNNEMSTRTGWFADEHYEKDVYDQQKTYKDHLEFLLEKIDYRIEMKVKSQTLLLQKFLKREDLGFLETNDELELLKVKPVLNLEYFKLLNVNENLEMTDVDLLKFKEYLELLKINEDLKKLCLKVNEEPNSYTLKYEIEEINYRVVKLKRPESIFFHNLSFDQNHMLLTYQAQST